METRWNSMSRSAFNLSIKKVVVKQKSWFKFSVSHIKFIMWFSFFTSCLVNISHLYHFVSKFSLDLPIFEKTIHTAASLKSWFQPAVKHFKQTIPIYFINLEASAERKRYIEKHLEEMDMDFRRVRAFNAFDVKNRVTSNIISVESLIKPNPNEIACIASHLIAIYRAVHDQKFMSESPYALILEDDVHFEFDIDFDELVRTAPTDFAVLQLMTSNAERVSAMFEEHKKQSTAAVAAAVESDTEISSRLLRGTPLAVSPEVKNIWEHHPLSSDLWSTQAYLIKKDAVKNFINRAVRLDDNGVPQVTLQQIPGIEMCKFPPCLFPHRIVADIYLYAALGKTYVSKIPLMNGGHEVGFASTIQMNKKGADTANDDSFRNISAVIDELRRHKDQYLPDYVTTLNSHNKRTTQKLLDSFLSGEWQESVRDHTMLV